jgi:uncharacterized membrane protein YphA (DoxX/SURF4 family)
MKVFVGTSFIIAGLALLFLNKPLSKVQKSTDELFGMGSVSLRFNRTVFYIVGALLAALGSLVLAGVFEFN